MMVFDSLWLAALPEMDAGGQRRVYSRLEQQGMAN